MSLSTASASSSVIATQRMFLGGSDDCDPVMCPINKSNAVGSTISTASDHQSRKILVKSGILEGAAGSSYVEIGNTKVVCAVNGPREQSGGDAQEGHLHVTISGIDQCIRHTIQTTLNSVVCLKKIARAEVDVEINVLSDDGGALSAALMAASLALVSANFECFDIILSVHLLLFNDGRIILDPDMERIVAEKQKQTENRLRLKTEDTMETSEEPEKNEFVSVTMAIAPSLGQVVFLDVGNGAIKKDVLTCALKFGFKKCLEIYPIVSKNLHSTVFNLL